MDSMQIPRAACSSSRASQPHCKIAAGCSNEMAAADAWTTMRYLHAQGKAKRVFAKELSLSRETVQAALRDDVQPRHSRSARAGPGLEPCGEQLGSG